MILNRLLEYTAKLPAVLSRKWFFFHEEAFEPLKPYLNRVVKIELEGSKQGLSFKIMPNQLQWVESTKADLCIHGQIFDLLKLLNAAPEADQLMRHNIKVIGDTGLLAALSQSLTLSKPDFAHWLASATSDLCAQTMMASAQSAMGYIQNMLQNRSQDLADYTSIESEILVNQLQMTPFRRDVLTLRDEVEKLKSSIKQYQRSL